MHPQLRSCRAALLAMLGALTSHPLLKSMKRCRGGGCEKADCDAGVLEQKRCVPMLRLTTCLHMCQCEPFVCGQTLQCRQAASTKRQLETRRLRERRQALQARKDLRRLLVRSSDRRRSRRSCLSTRLPITERRQRANSKL